MVIGIIGGGASGMTAALAASQNTDNQVLLFERQARLGRKLLATGNGRCNLTNLGATGNSYHGADPGFAKPSLSAFGVEDTLGWFEKMGLYTVNEASGRVYPYSDQANSVVDVLRFALCKPNIQLCLGQAVRRVKKEKDAFLVETEEQTYTCDRVIVACGGLAGTKLGGSMAGYQILRSLGHKVTPLRPNLVQLKSDWSGCIALKGVRCNCKAEIYRDDSLYSASTGELQFTEYGLSGPVIFEICRDVCHGAGKWQCRLDFLPDLDASDLFDRLQARRSGNLHAEELFTGILHNRLGRVLTGAVGIKANTPIAQLDSQQLQDACSAAKGFIVSICGTMGMDSAQVTAGGACTGEFDSATMESRVMPGLYACGEVLDIDGDCGGYNLQWAWSSGYVAGLHAGGAGL